MPVFQYVQTCRLLGPMSERKFGCSGSTGEKNKS
jgi:hypothetical protein